MTANPQPFRFGRVLGYLVLEPGREDTRRLLGHPLPLRTRLPP